MQNGKKNFPVRLSIVGAGQIAIHTHIPVLARMRNVDIIGIYDANGQKASQVARDFGIRKVFQSLEEMFASDVDVVDVCTPPQTHVQIILECIRNNKHCLVEKPFTLTASEADHIIALAAKSTAKVYPIQNYSFTPAFQRVKSIIQNNLIGNIVNVNIRYYASFNDHRHKYFLDKDHWIHDLPGDVFSDLTPHLAYMLVELIGKPESITATCKNVGGHSDILGDELCMIVTSGSAIGSLTLSYSSSLKLFVADIIGTKGGLRMDGNSQAVIRLGIIEDSTNAISRAREALSEIAQLIENFAVTGSNFITGRYSPGTYPHKFLFQKSINNIRFSENYPIDLKSVRDSVELCEKAFDQLKRSE